MIVVNILAKLCATFIVLFIVAIFMPFSYIYSPSGTATEVHLAATQSLYFILLISVLYIIWGKMKKVVFLAFGISAALCGLIIIGTHIHTNYYNKIEKVSSKDIYSGKIVNWKEVGGVDKKIKPFQRNEDSGSQTRMISFMGDTPLLTPTKEHRSTGMSKIISQVEEYRNYDTAIGYSFLFYSTSMIKNSNIKLLNINGIKPTRENIANNTYPLSTKFYAVTLKGNENKNIKPFIKWILSKQGQELIEKTGYTPLKTDKLISAKEVQ